jgi:hypothetical protein
MTDAPENPKAVIGHNFPPLARSIAEEQGDFAAITTAYLDEEYAAQPQITASLLDEARALPPAVEDDETKGKYTSLIKRLRDQVKNLESYHAKEKQPYLRGGQAVDQKFFGLIEKLARRVKTGKPGAADVLLARVTAYDDRREAEERARLQREADQRAAVAREAQRKAEEERRERERIENEARAAAEAAERARKPEHIEAKTEIAQAKQAEAQAQAGAATEAAITANVATIQAEEARVATFAKSADLMRHRGEDGTLSTRQQEPYAIIEDESLLDREALWPLISMDAKEKALRTWAKIHNFNKPMAGASIGRRPRSVVR